MVLPDGEVESVVDAIVVEVAVDGAGVVHLAEGVDKDLIVDEVDVEVLVGVAGWWLGVVRDELGEHEGAGDVGQAQELHGDVGGVAVAKGLVGVEIIRACVAGFETVCEVVVEF